jgi:GTP-binding protein HflX
VRKERESQRKRREKDGIATAALVGYTNSGKSSLLNALSGGDRDGSGAYVADRLFATLDTTTRRVRLGNRNILLVDTVGFVRRLPHELVDAFASTLEESVRADLLLIVVDASDPDAPRHYSAVRETLRNLGAEDKNQLVVLNKIDKGTVFADEPDTAAKAAFAGAVEISVLKKQNLQLLRERIESALQAGSLSDLA